MIHGFLSCSITMEELIKKLSYKYRCIAPCLRGYGYSSYNSKVKNFSDLAEDMKLFLK